MSLGFFYEYVVSFTHANHLGSKTWADKFMCLVTKLYHAWHSSPLNPFPHPVPFFSLTLVLLWDFNIDTCCMSHHVYVCLLSPLHTRALGESLYSQFWGVWYLGLTSFQPNLELLRISPIIDKFLVLWVSTKWPCSNQDIKGGSGIKQKRIHEKPKFHWKFYWLRTHNTRARTPNILTQPPICSWTSKY